MRYDDFRKTIITSSPADWVKIPGGPLFLDQLLEAAASGQRYVKVESHHYVAVWKPDVSLRLAWGIEEDRDLHYEGWLFSDPQIRRFYADTFWQGSLVDRTTLLHVDGGRCYLPDADPVIMGDADHPAAYTSIEVPGYTATASEVALARLLSSMSGTYPGATEFDTYMKRAHITEIPD